jgi:hypothetical protein
MKPMKLNRGLNSHLFIPAMFFLLLSLPIEAQNPVSFSGTWNLDNAKSDDAYKEYQVTCKIKQDSRTISIEETLLPKDNEVITSQSESYNLDGKETSKEEQGGTNKKSAKWSPDRKSLTIKETRKVGENVYGSNTVYKLSADGKILTVSTTDINDDSSPLVKVFIKKQD